MYNDQDEMLNRFDDFYSEELGIKQDKYGKNKEETE